MNDGSVGSPPPDLGNAAAAAARGGGGGGGGKGGKGDQQGAPDPALCGPPLHGRISRGYGPALALHSTSCSLS
jgi:hypothetical protein